MEQVHFQEDRMFIESVPVTAIAEEFGTPCYVYSRAAFELRYREFADALAGHPHRICYSVKANSNIAILDLLARLGSGFDIVSGGELERVIAAGGEPGSILFSGVGKSDAEIRRALEVGIGCFNVESLSELHLVDRLAGEAGTLARVSLRVNPDIDAKTHPYISTGLRQSKFGIASDRVVDAYRTASSLSHVEIVGIDCHIGSQITDTAPFIDACRTILALVDQLAGEGIRIAHVNMGGGLGVHYHGESPPSISEYVTSLLSALGDRQLELIIEPGRAIAAESGLLLTRVQYLKENGEHRFAVVDAGMNDLLRPALYQARKSVVQTRVRNTPPETYDVVGPVCESGDFIARDQNLALVEGDLVAVECTGAYGFAMSSNYNSRDRVPEIVVDGDRAHLVRERETIEQQLSLERMLPPD